MDNYHFWFALIGCAVFGLWFSRDRKYWPALVVAFLFGLAALSWLTALPTGKE